MEALVLLLRRPPQAAPLPRFRALPPPQHTRPRTRYSAVKPHPDSVRPQVPREMAYPFAAIATILISPLMGQIFRTSPAWALTTHTWPPLAATAMCVMVDFQGDLAADSRLGLAAFS